MQAVDISAEEFSIEALEARFEMEAVVTPPPETNAISICTVEA
jgi:hypothetical protein